jgi:hypothetical protein
LFNGTGVLPASHYSGIGGLWKTLEDQNDRGPKSQNLACQLAHLLACSRPGIVSITALAVYWPNRRGENNTL